MERTWSVGSPVFCSFLDNDGQVEWILGPPPGSLRPPFLADGNQLLMTRSWELPCPPFPGGSPWQCVIQIFDSALSLGATLKGSSLRHSSLWDQLRFLSLPPCISFSVTQSCLPCCLKVVSILRALVNKPLHTDTHLGNQWKAQLWQGFLGRNLGGWEIERKARRGGWGPGQGKARWSSSGSLECSNLLPCLHGPLCSLVIDHSGWGCGLWGPPLSLSPNSVSDPLWDLRKVLSPLQASVVPTV